MSWDKLAAQMDAEVDERLGDAIDYALDGTSFKCIKGFVLTVDDGMGIEELDDQLGHRKRIKIAKSKVAAIQSVHRIKAARLGAGVFKPGNAEPDQDDRYWIFDVQKA